jgi:AcrR family transcriptional regulator
MARPPEPEKRAAVLEQCFAAALDAGRLDLSLAALAKRTGVSARMLVYHFGDRDGLHRALAQRLEEELRRRFEHLEAGVAHGGAGAGIRSSAPPSASADAIRETVLALWSELAAPPMRALVRLALGVMLGAGDDEDAVSLARREGDAWTAFLAPRVGDAELASALALLVLGAAMDLVATDDAARGRRAIEAFLARAALDDPKRLRTRRAPPDDGCDR